MTLGTPTTACSQQGAIAKEGDLSEERGLALVLAMVSLYCVAMSWYLLDRHTHLGTSAFDMGIHEQATWLTAHGLNPFLTTRGMQVQGDHFSIIVFLIAPFYRLWEDARALLVLQTVVLALGALPVYWMAIRTLDTRRAALCMAALYLMQPTVQWMNSFDFHFNVLVSTFLLFALWFAESGQHVRYGMALLLGMLSTEIGGITVIFLGITLAWGGRRALGGCTVAAGALGMYVASCCMRFHNGGLPPAYVNLYQDRPWLDLLTTANLQYLFELLAPLAFLPILGSERLLPALPVLAGNLLSWRESQHSIHWQYCAAMVPFLVWAALLGARRGLATWRAWSTVPGPVARRGPPILVLLIAVTCIAIGPLHRNPQPAENALARAALSVVPPKESVSAENHVGAHLSARQESYLLPNPFQSAAWGGTPQALVDQAGLGIYPISAGALRRAVQDTDVNYLVFRPECSEGFPALLPDQAWFYTCLARTPEFGLVLARDGLVVFRRGAPHRPLAVPFPSTHLERWLPREQKH